MQCDSTAHVHYETHNSYRDIEPERVINWAPTKVNVALKEVVLERRHLSAQQRRALLQRCAVQLDPHLRWGASRCGVGT
jgi:hypothetical protein